MDSRIQERRRKKQEEAVVEEEDTNGKNGYGADNHGGYFPN